MWYDIEIVKCVGEARAATFRVHVKWWHPGFWLEGFRTLRAAGATISESLYFTFILVKQFAKKTRKS